MTRRGKGPLIPVLNAHNQFVLQSMGVPSGRDRTLVAERIRKTDPTANKPKVVEGEIDSLTALENLLEHLHTRGVIINKTVRGGSFGVEQKNAILVNPNSPIPLMVTQGSSDTASTTNTASTVAAMSTALTLAPGKWAVIVIVGIILSHSAGGTVGISAEIEGMEGTVRLVSTVPTTGARCEANIAKVAEADWIQGEQVLNLRARFRSNTAGTTSAKNPSIIGIAYRME